MEDRNYQRVRTRVQKYIQKTGKVDHKEILNNVNVDYDTLMRVLKELRDSGKIK